MQKQFLKQSKTGFYGNKSKMQIGFKYSEPFWFL